MWEVSVISVLAPASFLVALGFAVFDLLALRARVDELRVRNSLLLKGSAGIAIILSYGLVWLSTLPQGVESLILAPVMVAVLVVVVVVAYAAVVAFVVSFVWDVRVAIRWRELAATR